LSWTAGREGREMARSRRRWGKREEEVVGGKVGKVKMKRKGKKKKRMTD
jgi:hypothetical protein